LLQYLEAMFWRDMSMACCRDLYEAGPAVEVDDNQPRYGFRLLIKNHGQ
jgi:hypothetical protein